MWSCSRETKWSRRSSVSFDRSCDVRIERQPPPAGIVSSGMSPLKSLRAWLGVDAGETREFAPLRETLEALDHLEPDRARYLGAFAYLLGRVDRKSTRLNSSHSQISYAVFCLKKKKTIQTVTEITQIAQH